MKIKYIVTISIASFISLGLFSLPAEASCGSKESSTISQNPCAGEQ